MTLELRAIRSMRKSARLMLTLGAAPPRGGDGRLERVVADRALKHLIADDEGRSPARLHRPRELDVAGELGSGGGALRLGADARLGHRLRQRRLRRPAEREQARMELAEAALASGGQADVGGRLAVGAEDRKLAPDDLEPRTLGDQPVDVRIGLAAM